MKKRSPIMVVIYMCITFGIYGLFYFYRTKEEMNALGAGIPSFILIFLPIANIFWLWKWSCGVEKVTNNAISGALAFVLLFCLSVIGVAIVQSKLNTVATA